MKPENYDRVLYVLKSQEPEAERLGAKRIPGDCRFHIPGSLTDPILVRELGRYRTEFAMQAWAIERIGSLAPELLDRIAVQLLAVQRAGIVDRGDRIYLHVPRSQIAEVRRRGAQYDSHRRRVYLEAGQSVEAFRQYLTQDAVAAEAKEFGQGLRHRSKIAKEARDMATTVSQVTNRLRGGTEAAL